MPYVDLLPLFLRRTYLAKCVENNSIHDAKVPFLKDRRSQYFVFSLFPRLGASLDRP